MVKRRLLGVVKPGLSYLPVLFVDHSSFYTSTVSTNGVSCSFGEPKFFQHLAKVGINLSGLMLSLITNPAEISFLQYPTRYK